MNRRSSQSSRYLSLLVRLAVGCWMLGCESTAVQIPAARLDSIPISAIPDPLIIRLTGSEHRWRAAYPPVDGRSLSPYVLSPGSRLPVPTDREIILVLQSTDYLYTLAIPTLQLKEIAVPELEFRMTIRPASAGSYALVGDELCGLPGVESAAEMVIEPLEEFAERYRKIADDKD